MTTPNCLIPGRDARIDWQSPRASVSVPVREHACTRARAFPPRFPRRVVASSWLFDEIMTLSGYLGRAAATGRIIFSAEISRSLDLHVGGCTYEAGVARVVPDYDRRRYRTAGD